MPPFGFNVIGFVSANLGLGTAARATIRLLLEAGHPVSVFEVDANFGRTGSDRTFDYLKPQPGNAPPYSINLFHINPPEYEMLFRKGLPWLRDNQRLNVIVPFWELPAVPRSWLKPLGRTDLILAPTHYIEQMMAVQVDGVPVRHFPQTVFLPDSIAADRKRFGLPEDAVLFVSSFEMFSDINRKNPWAVIDAFRRAFGEADNAALVVKVNNAHNLTSFAGPLEKLHEAAKGSRIILIEQPLSYHDVLTLYASCDVLVSLHRAEGLGLSPMEAMTLGKPVIATGWSGNMDFMNDLNSCLVSHRLIPANSDSRSNGYNPAYVGAETVWADPDVDAAARWMKKLAADPNLRREIGTRAAASMAARNAECRKGEIWAQVKSFAENRAPVIPGIRSAGSMRGMRVLFCNRGNAFDQPGGDTVVMKRLKERLESRGVQVDYNADPRFGNVGSYDLVHIFNLTVPQATEPAARAAVMANVPFAVTSLQEDFPKYYHKATAAVNWFADYVNRTEGDAGLPLEAALAAATPISFLTSPFAAKSANRLFACGGTEKKLLQGLFGHDRVAVVPFGSSVQDIPALGALFEKQFGVSDFVLCVGRVELRKNQLMLLLALENSDVPVVFADGGFTYQPEYLALCKKLERKGRTIFTGRLSNELLVSAYRACRVHCLPSWYELPGLVSLEAALYGCNVAASSWGCLPDYLGPDCAWFEPDDPAGIRAAVDLAFNRERSPAAAERARQFTWESFGDLTLQEYGKILDEHLRFTQEIVAEAEQCVAPANAAAFLHRIIEFVEAGKSAEALGYYERTRSSIPGRLGELDRVDAIMGKLKMQLAGK